MKVICSIEYKLPNEPLSDSINYLLELNKQDNILFDISNTGILAVIKNVNINCGMDELELSKTILSALPTYWEGENQAFSDLFTQMELRKRLVHPDNEESHLEIFFEQNFKSPIGVDQLSESEITRGILLTIFLINKVVSFYNEHYEALEQSKIVIEIDETYTIDGVKDVEKFIQHTLSVFDEELSCLKTHTIEELFTALKLKNISK